eukprot:223261_1
MSPQQNESTSNTLNAPISNDENANPNTNNTNNNKRERDDDESDDQPIPPPLKKRKTKADRRFDLDPMSRSRILSEDCYHDIHNFNNKARIDCMVPKKAAKKLHKDNGLTQNNDSNTNAPPPPSNFYFSPLHTEIQLNPNQYNKL